MSYCGVGGLSEKNSAKLRLSGDKASTGAVSEQCRRV